MGLNSWLVWIVDRIGIGVIRNLHLRISLATLRILIGIRRVAVLGELRMLAVLARRRIRMEGLRNLWILPIRGVHVRSTRRRIIGMIATGIRGQIVRIILVRLAGVRIRLGVTGGRLRHRRRLMTRLLGLLFLRWTRSHPAPTLLDVPWRRGPFLFLLFRLGHFRLPFTKWNRLFFKLPPLGYLMEPIFRVQPMNRILFGRPLLPRSVEIPQLVGTDKLLSAVAIFQLQMLKELVDHLQLLSFLQTVDDKPLVHVQETLQLELRLELIVTQPFDQTRTSWDWDTFPREKTPDSANASWGVSEALLLPGDRISAKEARRKAPAPRRRRSSVPTPTRQPSAWAHSS